MYGKVELLSEGLIPLILILYITSNQNFSCNKKTHYREYEQDNNLNNFNNSFNNFLRTS